jgi:hypothetical protein
MDETLEKGMNFGESGNETAQNLYTAQLMNSCSAKRNGAVEH